MSGDVRDYKSASDSWASRAASTREEHELRRHERSGIRSKVGIVVSVDVRFDLTIAGTIR